MTASMLALTLFACGGPSAAVALDQATAKLAAGDYVGAEEIAANGIATKAGDPMVRWKLELARLEAQARGRQSDAARISVERIATEYAGQVTGELYATTASQLRDAGDPAAASAVLEAGLKRFPGDLAVIGAIDTQRSGTDVELLKQLGYVD